MAITREEITTRIAGEIVYTSEADVDHHMEIYFSDSLHVKFYLEHDDEDHGAGVYLSVKDAEHLAKRLLEWSAANK